MNKQCFHYHTEQDKLKLTVSLHRGVGPDLLQELRGVDRLEEVPVVAGLTVADDVPGLAGDVRVVQVDEGVAEVAAGARHAGEHALEGHRRDVLEAVDLEGGGEGGGVVGGNAVSDHRESEGAHWRSTTD